MKQRDDFNWNSYTRDYYAREQEQSMRIYKLIVEKNPEGPLLDNDGNIVFDPKVHDNWKELYHRVHNLKVKSVFECGCGSGYHLINLHNLNTNLKISGCDINIEQIELGNKDFNLSSYPFFDKIKILDFTDSEKVKDLETFDFVFTQAVTMHLRHDKAVKFLKNMASISNKYIFLIENKNAHNYPSLLAEAIPNFELVNFDKSYVTDDYVYLLKRRE